MIMGADIILMHYKAFDFNKIYKFWTLKNNLKL